MQTAPLPTSEALVWIRRGIDYVRREPTRWLGMSLVYLALALLLRLLVPFALFYNFILALITPAMLGGALIALRRPPPVPRAGVAGLLRALTLGALRELFQVFRGDSHAYSIIIACIVTLGLVVVIDIPNLLITGGSVVSGLTGMSAEGPLRFSTLFGIAVVTVLYVLLIMSLFFLVPLTLFGDRPPLAAAAESFAACLRHRAALLFFLVPFVAVDIVIMIGFNISHWLGYACWRRSE